MIHSMTAFARRQAETEGLLLTWEIRSVNHRFLEAQLRIPDTLRSIEHPLRDTLKKRLKRGKVDCTLRVEQQSGHSKITVNRALLNEVLAALEQIRKDVPEAGSPDPVDLLRWPGILGESAGIDDNEEAIGAIHQLFEETLTDLVAHRQREGAQLSETISQQLDEIDQIVSGVRKFGPTLNEQLLGKLRSRVSELMSKLDTGRQVDETRLEQEVVMLAQRADVTEELDRLNIHVEEVRTNLRNSGPQGRRLDFLAQELNREANTLGSKSAVAETSQKAVDLKVIIEQIREQVQNVE